MFFIPAPRTKGLLAENGSAIDDIEDEEGEWEEGGKSGDEPNEVIW